MRAKLAYLAGPVDPKNKFPKITKYKQMLQEIGPRPPARASGPGGGSALEKPELFHLAPDHY